MPTEMLAETVHAAFMDSLFKDGEPTEPRIVVEGMVTTFGFHPERLGSHREIVLECLRELHPNFKRSSGGGWSTLQMAMTKDGHQWGEHRNVEQLATLAIGLGLGAWLLPRDMWPILPGGMPYFGWDEKEAA